MSQSQRKKLKANYLVCLLAVVALLSSAGTMAATSTSKENAKEVVDNKRKNLSLVFEAMTSSNLYTPSSTSRSSSLDLTVAGSYKLDKNYTLSSAFVMSRNLQNSFLTAYDLPITLKHSAISLTKDIEFSPSLTMTLPTTEASREDKTLYTTLDAKGAFNTSVYISKQKIGLSYSAQLKKSFHKYTRDNLNNPNREYTFSNSISASTSLKKFSFAITGAYANNWDYFGTYTPTFAITEVISYDFTKSLTLSFGHTNSGRALGYNGVDSNIELFDGDSSTIFTSLTYVN